ncbi:hypothetical protein [Sphingomonas sp. Leaf67]|uniref:hypothetical protein n=1 Tax=Sphingomonas sp. Leaf67 TaxID=1736230 RepID=UPI000B1B2F33|nr:hypothetical protein [Sphingomonas sp. Leaf67]
MPTYLISIGDDRMLGLCTGDDPAHAIGAYYAGLDAYCEPSDELTETFSVATLEVPAASVAAVEALLDEDEAGDTLPEIEEVVMAAHPSQWQVVDVVIEGGRRSASLRS